MPRQIAIPQPGIDHSGFSKLTPAGGQRSVSRFGTRGGSSTIHSSCHDRGISRPRRAKLKLNTSNPAYAKSDATRPPQGKSKHTRSKIANANNQQIVPPEQHVSHTRPRIKRQIDRQNSTTTRRNVLFAHVTKII
jgi:hypothetical protein